MTEAEWLACADPQPMLDFLLREKADNRKLRLFACACCRQVWHLIEDQRSRDAVEVAERFADCWAPVQDLAIAQKNASLAATSVASRGVAWGAASAAALTAAESPAWYAAPTDAAWAAAWDAAADAAWDAAASVAWEAGASAAWDATRQGQASLLRDIVGNPFRSVAFEPAWRTPTALAQAAYNLRADDGTLDPVRLAILADALEEAGCADALTAVLRSPGPHYRGLWVLDLVLGKG